jgi:hypothetical protein
MRRSTILSLSAQLVFPGETFEIPLRQRQKIIKFYNFKIWFPTTVTVVVAIVVSFVVGTNLDNMDPKYSGNGDKGTHNFVKFVIWTLPIVAAIILTFNAANWAIKLAFWLTTMPFQIVRALPTPLDVLFVILCAGILAKVYLTKSGIVKALDWAVNCLGRIRRIIEPN